MNAQTDRNLICIFHEPEFPVNDAGNYLKTQFSLEGKSALLTGGAGGIGRALAFALCSAGATTAVCDLNLAQAEEVAATLR